jgi:hypothetical protein
MHRSHRQRLLARLLEATGATSVGLVFAAACGGHVAHDAGQEHGGGSTGGGTTSSGGATSTGGSLIITTDPGGMQATGPTPQTLRECLSMLAAGGAGGAESAAAAGASTAGDGGAIGAATERCPTTEEAKALVEGQGGLRCTRVHEVNVGPVLEQGQCCYDFLVTTSACYVGRAFLVEDGFLKSTVRKGGSWTHGAAPQVSDLSPKTRRALADAWAKDGLFEHASVATFARFAIQLLAIGAPARLLHETLAAGRDEIRHAELCFALASAYAGEPLEADCFPIGDTLQIDRTLPAIVMETVVEGCIGETLAAMQAAAQLELSTDPAVVAALEATIEDESRHAELAWRVVAWAVRTGGPEVRTAAERAFAGFRPPSAPRIDMEDVCLESFAAHGRLTAEHARAIALEALDSIVRPCAAALLERNVMSESAAYA